MALAGWMAGPDGFHIERRTIRAGGCGMHYLCAGSGPTLILLHGVLGTAECWLPSMMMLGLDSTVYALDAVGVGRSERKAGLDAGLHASAERVAAFMRAAGIHKADIVATSHGGAVAMTLAMKHPERLRSLVLHAPANPYSNLADPLIHFYGTRLGQWFAHRVAGLPRHLQNLALGRMYGNPALIPKGSLDSYVESLRVPGTVDHVLKVLKSWARDMQSLEEGMSLLHTVPALLIWGTRDRAVSLNSAFRLQQEFGNVQLRIIPGAGHLPYEEVPEVFSAIVRDFLRRLDRTDNDPGKQHGPMLVKRRMDESQSSVA